MTDIRIEQAIKCRDNEIIKAFEKLYREGSMLSREPDVHLYLRLACTIGVDKWDKSFPIIISRSRFSHWMGLMNRAFPEATGEVCQPDGTIRAMSYVIELRDRDVKKAFEMLHENHPDIDPVYLLRRAFELGNYAWRHWMATRIGQKNAQLWFENYDGTFPSPRRRPALKRPRKRRLMSNNNCSA